MSIYNPDDLPFEFRALELALELTCLSLDAQVGNNCSNYHPIKGFISGGAFLYVVHLESSFAVLISVKSLCDCLVKSINRKEPSLYSIPYPRESPNRSVILTLAWEFEQALLTLWINLTNANILIAFVVISCIH